MFKKNILKLFFPSFLLLVFIILTIFKISGSSIGIYSYFFYGDFHHDGTIVGNGQGIRSDEWMVRTPWILAQAQNNFEENNRLFGNGINFTTTSVPVKNWITFFRPQYWAFFILPVEYAFSWMWWFRVFLLIASSYFGILLITHKIQPSLFLSLAFFFSPFIQWWISTSAVEILSFGLIITITFYLLLHSKNLTFQIINLLLFIYFSIGFAFELYPPFQIPVAIAIVFIMVGYLLNNLILLKNFTRSKFLFFLFFALTSIFLILFLFYNSAKESINIIRHTTYPGQRQLTGGDLNLYLLFGGIYNFFSQLNSQSILPGLGNQCESSSFLLISVFLIPYFLYYELKKLINHEPLNGMAIVICLYIGLILCWGIFGLPSWFAKMTLLNFVQPTRTIIGLGLINIIAIVYFLYIYRIPDVQSINYKIISFLYTSFITLFYIELSIKLHRYNQTIIPKKIDIFIISITIGLMIFLLLNQYKNIFFTLFLFISILSSIFINPLQIGLDPILSEDLSKSVQTINKGSSINDKWVVYDNLYLSNYLAANGAHVLTGTYLYPDLALWQNFDMEKQSIEIYNRYSHVTFSENNSNEIKFTLKQGDWFDVNINPCNPLLETLGVKYFVFVNKVSSYSCLSALDHINYPNQSIYLYTYSK